jgi:hypothetical protein
MTEDQAPHGPTPAARRLRIGVTGHRRLPDDPALAERVSQALAHIRALAPSSCGLPSQVTIVSPLAEGADRLVAAQVLREREATLEVPLPLARAEYVQDFRDDESRRAFEQLLARADHVVSLPPTASRTEAYEQVGRYVVDHADVVLALWDGEPARGRGGTADVVAYAREQGVPLLWIKTAPPYPLVVERGGRGTCGAADA